VTRELAADALLGRSQDTSAVCAAIRLLGPWVAQGKEDICQTAWELCSKAPDPLGPIWAWWIACRHDAFVAPARATIAGCELPHELRRSLLWTLDHPPDGVSSFCEADRVVQPYERALRSLEREASRFSRLESVVAGVRAGARDLGAVVNALPGGWNAAELRDGRRAMINDAFAARDAAWAAGVDPDFPVLVMPRFGALDDVRRRLVLDLLSGLPGARGEPLDRANAELPGLPDGDVFERCAAAAALRQQGLPVDAAEPQLQDWLDATRTPTRSAELAARGGTSYGALLYQATVGNGIVGDEHVLQVLSLLRKPPTGASARSIALAVLQVWMERGAGGQAADLVELLVDEPGSLSALAADALESALSSTDCVELSLLALTVRMREAAHGLSLIEETLAWQ
jgi:hypothetical protein